MRQSPPRSTKARLRSSQSDGRISTSSQWVQENPSALVQENPSVSEQENPSVSVQENPTVQQWMRDKGICEDSNPTSWKVCLLGTISLALAIVTAFGAKSMVAELFLRTADTVLPLHVHRRPQAAASSVHAQARKTALSGDLDKAVTMYKKAELECDLKNPARAELLNDLGVALTASGKNGEAQRYLKEAIQLNPSLIAAYNNLAISQMLAGDRSSAMSTLDEAIKIQPQNEYAALKLKRMWTNSSPNK